MRFVKYNNIIQNVAKDTFLDLDSMVNKIITHGADKILSCNVIKNQLIKKTTITPQTYKMAKLLKKAAVGKFFDKNPDHPGQILADYPLQEWRDLKDYEHFYLEKNTKLDDMKNYFTDYEILQMETKLSGE